MVPFMFWKDTKQYNTNTHIYANTHINSWLHPKLITDFSGERIGSGVRYIALADFIFLRDNLFKLRVCKKKKKRTGKKQVMVLEHKRLAICSKTSGTNTQTKIHCHIHVHKRPID